MQCSACQADNPAGKKFCGECGATLSATCPSCTAPNPPGNRFCGDCGASLVGLFSTTATQTPLVPGGPRSPSEAQPVAQRRVCSVLFVDLVGFTPLSEARDPEEVRELLSRYFETARTVIARYGGVVEKFIGDAVMAVWGTPTAAEGDAERAVRAALDLVDAVAQLGRDAGAAGLRARAGVVTGPVAVTLGASGEGMVAGDAVNTAARVQGAAEPGSVLVDEGTWRIAAAGVEFSSAGDHVLKGKAEPVALWRAERVLSGIGGTQRIDGLEARFVGRDAELRLVKELFHTCIERSTTRLVSIMGAAGVGKSRLAWEFEKYLDGLASTVRWHRGRCLSYGEGVAFWALAQMVRQRFGIAEEDPSAVAAEKLVAGVASFVPNEEERAYVQPRLAQLLGADAASAATTLSRDELFAGWRLFFERLAGEFPVVLLVEDLHHADAGLLDFLEHLLDWSRDVPIFVLTLARPELEERRPGWGTSRRNSTTLSLDALDSAAMEALLDELVPGMPDAAKAAIAARAEGIPLYAVETVRMLIDRDVVQPIDGIYRLVADVGELAVPASLQSLLAARLDALPAEAQRLVAAAAVLGGTFPPEAVTAITGEPADEVREILAELVRREVLAVRADPLSPERGHYGFVQTMFRQVAYDTLSRRERKAAHLAVAAHLQGTFADEGEEIAEVIAAHLLDALAAVPDDPDVPHLRERAVSTLIRAGERAQRTGSPGSAVTAYVRAADLRDQSGNVDDEFAAAALRERAAATASATSSFDTAAELYRQAREVYRRQARVRDAARADAGYGSSMQRQGRLDEAREHLTQALAALEDQDDADTVRALAELATLEAFSGGAGEAERLSARALALAQALDLPNATLTELFIIRGISHGMANRWAQAVANFREAVTRAEAEQDSAAAGRALLNLANVVVSNDPTAAAEASRAAIDHCRRIGFRFALTFAISNLIHALLLTGDWDAAVHEYDLAVSADGLGEDVALASCAVLLHSLRGDEAALAAVLPIVERRRATQDPQDLAGEAAAFAAAATCRDEPVTALRHAKLTLEHVDALGLGADAFRWSWPIAADSALALGDVSEAERLLEWLEGFPQGDVRPLLRAERLRTRARVWAAQGDSRAADAFATAADALRAFGSPYHLAVGLLDQAEYLRNSGESQGRADGLVTEAATIARRLGSLPLIARADGMSATSDATAVAAVHPVP